MSELDLSGARILIVDDVPANLEVLWKGLETASYQVLVATNGKRALEIANGSRPDLILLDVMMPGMDGFETCRQLKATAATQDIPVIFLTAQNETSGILEGFEAGGVDYILKPFRNEEVLVRVRTHLERALLMQELDTKNDQLTQANQALEAEIARGQRLTNERDQLSDRLSLMAQREAERWGLKGIVGHSKSLQKILRDISLMQQAQYTSVLVTGESGTGKEMIARAFHASSFRADGPFIAVNCATIPTELAESLLFGHVKGAFTGADKAQAGFFVLAHTGTLFLDEVGEMPLTLQAKLLRVLEDGKVRSVGAQNDQAVDVRIVAATNTDLQQGITALGALEAHDYPGNIRQLRNIIERAVIESRGGDIEVHHLNLDSTPVVAIEGSGVGELIPLEALERRHILQVLEYMDWVIKGSQGAAQILGLNEGTLRSRMRKLGISRPTE